VCAAGCGLPTPARELSSSKQHRTIRQHPTTKQETENFDPLLHLTKKPRPAPLSKTWCGRHWPSSPWACPAWPPASRASACGAPGTCRSRACVGSSSSSSSATSSSASAAWSTWSWGPSSRWRPPQTWGTRSWPTATASSASSPCCTSKSHITLWSRCCWFWATPRSSRWPCGLSRWPTSSASSPPGPWIVGLRRRRTRSSGIFGESGLSSQASSSSRRRWPLCARATRATRSAVYWPSTWCSSSASCTWYGTSCGSSGAAASMKMSKASSSRRRSTSGSRGSCTTKF
jgi:hypothetical protein